MKTKVKIPKGVTKTDIYMLNHLKKVKISWPHLPKALDEGIYHFSHKGLDYDFIYNPSTEDRLFILLNGDFNRKKYTLPVFQRWSWAKAFPGHCLYIADPTLYLNDELGLAWYIGTSEKEVLPTIAKLIKKVVSTLKIASSNIIFYASSGGAFASLRLSTFFPKTTVVAINPQIDVTQYNNKSVDFFLNQCFNGISREEAITKYPKRFSILYSFKKIKKNKILYVQNVLDKHHYETHFKLFANKFGLDESNNYRTNKIEAFLFAHAEGHKKAETKENFPTIIERAIKLSGQ